MKTSTSPGPPTYDRERYRSQAIGVVGVMRSLLAKLHELDIYDRSMVIIAGDHGSGRSPDLWIDPADPARYDFNLLKARGSPLLLVKPLAPRAGTFPDRLLVSSTPVTLLDIPVTILTELGLGEASRVPVERGVGALEAFDRAHQGRSLFSLAQTDDRPRRHDAYSWQRFNTMYLPPITEYIVNGDVRDDQSWSKRRTFLPPE